MHFLSLNELLAMTIAGGFVIIKFLLTMLYWIALVGFSLAVIYIGFKELNNIIKRNVKRD